MIGDMPPLSWHLLLLASLGCQQPEPDPADPGESASPGDSAAPGDSQGSEDSDPPELFALDCASLGDPPLEALPDGVPLRTSQQSFNQDWYVALLDGAIWVKSNEEVTGEEGEWSLLGETGRPEGDQLGNFGAPGAVAEISVDGVHLTALSDEGHFYRGSDMTGDVLSGFQWTDAWGGLMADGAGLSQEFSTRCGWDVADSHPLGVAYYEDSNGSQHSVGLGVAHVYRLGEQGRRIYFNDWWLPEDWSRQICGPERGSFAALDISVSASTMFLVGHQGQLYTRLYDFDTGGENPLYTYSYIVGADGSTTRRLPAEDWLRQPDIEQGRIVPRVTIYQDGQGNAARVLRVEGSLDGAGGYFEKRIYDQSWDFVQTGALVEGPFLDEAAAAEGADPEDFALQGTLCLESDQLELEIPDFNIVCSPAQVQLRWEGEPVQVGGQPLLLELHHVHTWVEETRATDFWDKGVPAEVQAALLIPEEIASIDDEAARQAVQALLADKQVINFLGQVSTSGIELSEIMWTEPFRVPAEEKAFWSAFELVAGP